MRFRFGKHDDWLLTANLRKGTQSNAFSAELQGSCPLNRLSSPGRSGHLMAQYFTGYGENLLRYNEREPWTLRLGYAVSRRRPAPGAVTAAIPARARAGG